MLSHLPVRYRVAIWVAGLLAFAGVGAWLARDPRIPVEWQLGAVIGFALGALAVAAFLRALAGPDADATDGDGGGQVA